MQTNNNKTGFRIWQLLAGFIAKCLFGATLAVGSPPGSVGDNNIQYFGRWDFSTPGHAVSYWGGAYIKLNFTGTTVKINLGNTNNFYAKIDNGFWTTYTQASGLLNLTPTPLANGTHSLSVAEGQDYNYLYDFQGLTLDAGATTSPPTVSSNLIEFVGDSITAGASDPQSDVSSYGWVCAENLGCEHTHIAYPGIALVNGYGFNAIKTGMDVQYFKEQDQPYTNSPPWNFTNYTANLVVINLGQNDSGSSVPANAFLKDYTNYLANIRSVFPNAEIFPMEPFSRVYGASILAAVNARNSAGDSHVHYINTTGWLTNGDFVDGVHPTQAGHIKVAGHLDPLLAPYLVKLAIGPAGANMQVKWSLGALQEATNLDGPWTTISTGTSPYTIVTAPSTQIFYRVEIQSFQNGPVGLKIGLNNGQDFQYTSGSLLPTDLAGAPGYAQSNWNNLGKYTTGLNPLAEGGAPTVMAVSMDSVNTSYQSNGAQPTPDGNLMNTYGTSLTGANGNTIPEDGSVVTGVNGYNPASSFYNNKPLVYLQNLNAWMTSQGATKYDIVVYSDAVTENGGVGKWWIEGATGSWSTLPYMTLSNNLTPFVYLKDATNFINTLTYVQVPTNSNSGATAVSGNFIVFPGLTNDSILLRCDRYTSGADSPLNAVQIIPHTP